MTRSRIFQTVAVTSMGKVRPLATSVTVTLPRTVWPGPSRRVSTAIGSLSWAAILPAFAHRTIQG